MVMLNGACDADGWLQCHQKYREKRRVIFGRDSLDKYLESKRSLGVSLYECSYLQVEVRFYCQRFLKQIRNIRQKKMLNLDDLILQEPESYPHQSNSSDAKQTNLPELIEYEDHLHQRFQADLFFDQALHPNLSSTFSNLDCEEPDCSEDPDKAESAKKRGRGKGNPINKSRNQTKNIPKNFGKGIISFVEHNKAKLSPLARRFGLNYDDLSAQLRELKRSINTIAELRELWTGEKGQCLRIISNLFFRKHALEYIFNSRISSYSSHIKYRCSLWKALEQPNSFNHIKQY